MDVRHESAFSWTPAIMADKDHFAGHFNIVEAAAGVLSARKGESPRSDPDFESIITQIVKDSQRTIVVIFRPMDNLTYVCWKPKEFPKHMGFKVGVNWILIDFAV